MVEGTESTKKGESGAQGASSSERTQTHADSKTEDVTQHDQLSRIDKSASLDGINSLSALRGRYEGDLLSVHAPEDMPSEYVRERQRLDTSRQGDSLREVGAQGVEVPASAFYLAEAKAWNAAENMGIASVSGGDFVARLGADRALGPEYAEALRCSTPELQSVPPRDFRVEFTWHREDPVHEWRTARAVIGGKGQWSELRIEPGRKQDGQELNDADEFREATGVLVNGDRAEIDLRKLTDYALNPEHEEGGHKARVIRAATGLGQEHADTLLEQLRDGVRTRPAIPGHRDDYGTRFTVDMPVQGPTGRATLRTGWIYGTGSRTPRLVTLYVR